MEFLVILTFAILVFASSRQIKDGMQRFALMIATGGILSLSYAVLIVFFAIINRSEAAHNTAQSTNPESFLPFIDNLKKINSSDAATPFLMLGVFLIVVSIAIYIGSKHMSDKE